MNVRNICLWMVAIVWIGAANACSGSSTASDAATGDVASSDSEITKFTFRSADNPALATDVTATITGTRIAATLPSWTHVTDLKATFTTSGVSVLIGMTAQNSGITANDFTQALTYTVNAADGSTKDFIVAVTAPSLRAKVEFPTGMDPGAIAIGDLNSDGKPDLAIANGGSDSVSILLNTAAIGATTPTFAAKSDVTGTSPSAVVLSDLNADGKPDLAIVNYGTGNGSVSVLLNTTAAAATTPTFATRVDYGTISGAVGLAVGDVNGDGKPDLVLACYMPSRASVLLSTTSAGATTPSFASPVDFTTPAGTRSIALADLNGDGRPDMATSNLESHSVSVFLNTTAVAAGTPSFSTSVEFPSVFPSRVGAGDFNGDGKPDLAAPSGSTGAPSTIAVALFLNTTAAAATTPSLASKVDVMPGGFPSGIAIADMNSDARPDLVVANVDTSQGPPQQPTGSVAVILNTTTTGAGTPTFAPRFDFFTGTRTVDTSVGDLNGDGKPDVAVPLATTVAVLLAE